MVPFKTKYGAWAVVTGASDGIGKSIAAELAKSGLNLFLVARRAPMLDAAALALSRDHGVKVEFLALDLSTGNACQELLAATKNHDVGLLVAAAGFGTSGPFIENDVTNECNMIDVNCRATAHLAHAFGKRFALQKRGGIILFSSLVAFQGVPRSANYAATKAYVQTLAEGLYTELKPLGVDVLATAPGPVTTGFGARASMTMSGGAKPEDVAHATLRALGKTRTVRPGLIAKGLGWSLAMLPRFGRILVMTKIMSGMARKA